MKQDAEKNWAVFSCEKAKGEKWGHEISVETREEADTEKYALTSQGRRVKLRYILDSDIPEYVEYLNRN